MTLIRALIRRLCQTIVAWLDRTEPVQCTGVSAVWCPVCGDCTCPDREQSMDYWNCPLHGEHSKHAEGGEGWMVWNAALNEASELIARLDGDA